MNRIRTMTVVGVAAALLLGGLVIGSNVGFKLNLAMNGAGENVWISLPYRSTTLTNADDMVTQLLDGGRGSVTRFLPGLNLFQVWTVTGTGGSGTNFDFIPGDGYRFNPSNPQTSVIIVGASDPFLTVPQADPTLARAAGFVANDDYWLSIPYHTTASRAEDLIADLPGGFGIATKFNPLTNPPTVVIWTISANDPGGIGSVGGNFDVELGTMYKIRTSANSSGIIFSHF